jgi:hypothetical protein
MESKEVGVMVVVSAAFAVVVSGAAEREQVFALK